MAIRERDLYIGGAWRPAIRGGRYQVINPYTETVLGSIAAATSEDVNLAVEAAIQTFKIGAWSKISGARRAKFLMAIAEKVCLVLQNLS